MHQADAIHYQWCFLNTKTCFVLFVYRCVVVLASLFNVANGIISALDLSLAMYFTIFALHRIFPLSQGALSSTLTCRIVYAAEEME